MDKCMVEMWRESFRGWGMKKLASIALFLGGLALIVFGALRGEGSVGIFFIFPYVVGSGLFMLLGILLVFSSFFIQFLSLLKRTEIEAEGEPRRVKKVEGGALIFIGPVPIVVGSNRRIALILLAIAVAILLAILIYSILSSIYTLP
jgi:uncharacterized protein (TIGR00304 family)